MVSISAPVFDLAGSLLLRKAKEKSDLASISRRVSRTATLDGGVVVTDGGYAVGDRTMKIIQPKISTEEADAATYLLKNYSYLILSCREGCFLASPANLSINNGDLNMTLLVTESLS